MNKFRISFFFFLFLLVHFNAESQPIDTLYTEPRNVDVKLFRLLNNSRTETMDKIIRITDFSIFPVSLITPATLFTVSRINNHTYDENSAVLLGISELTSVGVTFAVKNIVKRSRPFVKLKNVNNSEKDKSFLDSYSFPSGHTSSAFCLATSLTLRYNNKPVLITGLYSYALIVSLGRIYLGNHYPSDVLAGMVTGSGSALLIYSLRKEIINQKNNILGEKNKPDSNNSDFVTALFFSSVIVSDIFNYYLFDKYDNIKLNLYSTGYNNYLILNCNF